jgi:hypothetical protein
MLTAPYSHHLVLGLPPIPLLIQTPPSPETCHSGTDEYSCDPVSVLGEMHYETGTRPYDGSLALSNCSDPKE